MENEERYVFGVEMMCYMFILTEFQEYFDSCVGEWWSTATPYSGWYVLIRNMKTFCERTNFIRFSIWSVICRSLFLEQVGIL